MGPQHLATRTSLHCPSDYLYGITAGPDGNLWFTQNRIGRIARIT
jgi:hypothetical protein